MFYKIEQRYSEIAEIIYIYIYILYIYMNPMKKT